MKISYNWLKKYIPITLAPEEISVILTGVGLEVEGIEKVQTVPGGLEGLVIGKVTFRVQHPNADRLSITKVDIGAENELEIVCGAPNVAEGQKVVVAPVGCTIYPMVGEPLLIKKSKIRGEVSEGMICAEDEIGLGTSHAGIIVLPEDAPVGILAKDYFRVSDDYCFEVGLTPNRVDAASHIGTARDLAAALKIQVSLPSVEDFKVDSTDLNIHVSVENTEACPRYSGIVLKGVTVKESPEWLKNALKAIGLRPINNVVDVTNFVLHEIGQPLHAFDAKQIIGNKVIVKTVGEDTRFVTLDGQERTLSSEDLMICNEKEPMCIAGVMGGLHSGVSENTTDIFIESAYFNPVSVRKTGKRYNLKTDSSFRFERGADPNSTVYALKRAAMLMKEVAGGEIASHIIDLYPKEIPNAEINLSYEKVRNLIGTLIPKEEIKSILNGMGIKTLSENEDGLTLSIPTAKVDVTREVDVIEEILRFFGYNNVPIPSKVNASLSLAVKPNRERIQDAAADFMTSNGFNEIMSNSLTKSSYVNFLPSLSPEQSVYILNPLSSDLNAMRQTLLFSGLEAIAYNQNRKNPDLKLYEFGRIYKKTDDGFSEEQRLALFVTGRKTTEQWNTSNDAVDFYFLKGFVDALLLKLNVRINNIEELSDSDIQGLVYRKGKTHIVRFGEVSKSLLKKTDIERPVFYADFNWEYIIQSQQNKKTTYRELSKYPAVRRDLSILVDKSVKFLDLKEIALQSERNLLKEVSMFDKYEGGDKLPEGKKSYALTFVLQDEDKTLTDKQIDAVMQRLIQNFEKRGFEIRK